METKPEVILAHRRRHPRAVVSTNHMPQHLDRHWGPPRPPATTPPSSGHYPLGKGPPKRDNVDPPSQLGGAGNTQLESMIMSVFDKWFQRRFSQMSEMGALQPKVQKKPTVAKTTTTTTTTMAPTTSTPAPKTTEAVTTPYPTEPSETTTEGSNEVYPSPPTTKHQPHVHEPTSHMTRQTFQPGTLSSSVHRGVSKRPRQIRIIKIVRKPHRPFPGIPPPPPFLPLTLEEQNKMKLSGLAVQDGNQVLAPYPAQGDESAIPTKQKPADKAPAGTEDHGPHEPTHSHAPHKPHGPTDNPATHDQHGTHGTHGPHGSHGPQSTHDPHGHAHTHNYPPQTSNPSNPPNQSASTPGSPPTTQPPSTTAAPATEAPVTKLTSPGPRTIDPDLLSDINEARMASGLSMLTADMVDVGGSIKPRRLHRHRQRQRHRPAPLLDPFLSMPQPHSHSHLHAPRQFDIHNIHLAAHLNAGPMDPRQHRELHLALRQRERAQLAPIPVGLGNLFGGHHGNTARTGLNQFMDPDALADLMEARAAGR